MEHWRGIMGDAVIVRSDFLDEYKQMTKDFEGLRLRPYKCSAGKLTIGYGRNLEDVGISKEEADALFNKDFTKAMEDAAKLLNEEGITSLHKQRFYVLTDMVFNLGYTGTKKFKKFLYALKKDLYDDAAKEMLDSQWAVQVGSRAIKLAAMMKDAKND